MERMNNIPFTNLAVFVIFFGIALIEAIQKSNWLEAGLFLALGFLSLWADFSKNISHSATLPGAFGGRSFPHLHPLIFHSFRRFASICMKNTSAIVTYVTLYGATAKSG